MTPEQIEEMKRDRDRPQVKRLSGEAWVVVIDGPSPGWIGVLGPSLPVNGPTTATNLNGEDWIARHADARRIARVPDMEAHILAQQAEIDRLRAKVDARLELRFRHLTIALGLCADALDEAHSELRDHADTHPSIRQIDEARDAARAALTAYREAGQ